MQTMHIIAALFGLGLGSCLSGCAIDTNEGRRLPQLPFEEETLAARSKHAYRSADRESFELAIARYQAVRGDHTIPVGRYLLAQTVLMLPDDTTVDRLTLKDFSLSCRETRPILPRAQCTLSMRVDFAQRGAPRTMTATLRKEVGPLYVAEGGAYQIILDQIKSLLKSVVLKAS